MVGFGISYNKGTIIELNYKVLEIKATFSCYKFMTLILVSNNDKAQVNEIFSYYSHKKISYLLNQNTL
jgi:hypothetical protein